MSHAKELLEQATPLPWVVYDGPRPGIDGPDGSADSIVMYGGEFEGDYAGVNTPENADLIVYAVNRLPDYETAVEALLRLYLGMGGNRDDDHTSCTADECWWRQAKDALVSLGVSVDTSLTDEVPA